jgi:hypothetical protein
VLRGDELIILPFLVSLYLIAASPSPSPTRAEPRARAFGMALTGGSLIAALGIAAVFIGLGR